MFHLPAIFASRVRSSRRRTLPQQSRECCFEVNAELLESRTLLSAIVWSDGPDLPQPRTDAVAVVAPNDTVYLLGGASTLATSTPTLSASGTAWSTGQNIDTPRSDLGAVRVGNSIYLFGGTGNTEGINEVLQYDYRLGDSQDLAKMSKIRYDFGYASDSQGRVYAIGGIGVRADGEIWSDAERFDPSTGTWSAIAPLPVPLHGISAVGDGQGHLFVFGGSTTIGDAGIQGKSYRYDIATDTWSEVAPMLVATRDSAAVMNENGEILVLGGMTSTGATAAVQVYNPATNSWSEQTALPEAVYSHAAVIDSLGRVVVAGGFDSAGVATAAVRRSQRLNVAETAPVITSTAVTEASLDKVYTYDVNSTGNPAPTYSLVSAPNGMTIDSTQGLISWQPVASQLGVQSVTVRATNSVGFVDQTFDIAVVADTIPPTTPTNVTVSAATETSIALTWTPSTDAVGVDHYEVYSVKRVGSRFHKRYVYTLEATSPTPNATVTGLSPLSSTRLTVQAVDAAGNKSGRSTFITATTLAAPDLSFKVGTQTTGTVQSPAKKPLTIKLSSRANPSATFSIVSGPSSMTIDASTGMVHWTPTVAEIGLQEATFRATNSVGSAELTISFDIIPDVPQLSVEYNPVTGGQRYALAGTLFTAQIHDASNTPGTYSLVSAPAGMTIDSATGFISWTPVGTQGGLQTVTVRDVNDAGATDLTFDVNTLFTGAPGNVLVTGTTLLEPTASWNAPQGEGANLVAQYRIDGVATWRAGRFKRSHRVSYTVPASQTNVLMTGLLTGKSYKLSIVALDAAGNEGLANTGTTFVSTPSLPQVRWTVNGLSSGTGVIVAGKQAEIVLSDQRPDPSVLSLVSGPAGLTFDPTTRTATWTPGAGDVTTGFNTTNVTFRATNNVGSVDVVVPLRVLFSGAVQNATTTRYGNQATASWTAPTDNVAPVSGYRITRYWTWAGRNRSATWTVGADVTSITFGLSPTGAVVHKGISITPLDANGNEGVSTGLIRYGERQNNLPPIAVDDSYQATEDTKLVVNVADGVRANDIDTDNTPLINPLVVYLVSGPGHGTLSLNTNGSFNYTPDKNFNGVDSFTYWVNDGKFNSNVATATINVAAVNDAPSALDDYYQVSGGNPLVVDAAHGLLANDSDVDGDPLSVAVVSNPANGQLTLNADGSFTYTANAGFTGTDRFTYVASDASLNSRTATVSISVGQVPPPSTGTKFYSVDYASHGTFEYTANGTLVENYALANANRKPLGVTSNASGSLVWTIDKSRRVFVYDNAGNQLGSWIAKGLRKPEGIATDGIDVWIVDRVRDRVYRYAGAANRRAGSIGATDSFALHRANRNPKGITTDGTTIWVVNSARKADVVFKYNRTGRLIGHWRLDPANANPTGITIDPSNVQHVWVSDNRSDSVFQYNNGANRKNGTPTADSVFTLNSANLNVQGIADPLAGQTALQPINDTEAASITEDNSDDALPASLLTSVELSNPLAWSVSTSRVQEGLFEHLRNSHNLFASVSQWEIPSDTDGLASVPNSLSTGKADSLLKFVEIADPKKVGVAVDATSKENGNLTDNLETLFADASLLARIWGL